MVKAFADGLDNLGDVLTAELVGFVVVFRVLRVVFAVVLAVVFAVIFAVVFRVGFEMGLAVVFATRTTGSCRASFISCAAVAMQSQAAVSSAGLMPSIGIVPL